MKKYILFLLVTKLGHITIGAALTLIGAILIGKLNIDNWLTETITYSGMAILSGYALALLYNAIINSFKS